MIIGLGEYGPKKIFIKLQKLKVESMINCDSPVTNPCNFSLTPAQKRFLDKATKINLQEGRPFCFQDFLDNMSHGAFKQQIHRLKDRITIVQKSIPTFYKVSGIDLPLDWHNVTPKPMGSAQNLVTILESLKTQPTMIHDIKIQFTSNLHQGLVKRGATTHPKNKSIKCSNLPITDNHIIINALVYPKTTQLSVSCTYKPIIYDVASLLYLIEILSQASMSLFSLSQTSIPDVKDWIVTQYHMNKDGLVMDGEKFHITIGEMTNGLIRYYSKKLPSGKTVVRLEQIRSPKTSIMDMMKKTANASFGEFT